MSTTTTSKEIWPEIGATGLKQRGGYILEEFLPELTGPRGMRVYREMQDNSPAVGASLGAIEMLCRQVTWGTDPPKDPDNVDLKRTDLVETCRNDMSFTWSDTLVDMLSMLGYGFAPLEICFKERRGDVNDDGLRSKYSDGLIGLRKLPIRGQETVQRWELDDAGGIQGLHQIAAPDYRPRFLPIEKLLLFRPKAAKNNPEGRSILRTAYRAYYHEKRIMAIEGIGIERDLAGMPVVGIPAACMGPDASPEQKQTYKDAKKLATGLRRDEYEGIVKPIQYEPGTSNQLYTIELLTTGGKRQFDTTAILQQRAREIVMSMLYDLLLMGQPNTIQYKGSRMPEFFAVSLGAWLDSICDVWNMFLVPRLFRMNGWPLERLPTLRHSDVQVPDLSALGDYISKLSGAKMPLFPDDDLEQHLRQIAGMPPRSKTAPPPPPAPEPAPAPPAENGDPTPQP